MNQISNWNRQIMKLLNTFSEYRYIRIPQCNLVIWFDDSLDNKLREWNGVKSATRLKQISKKNHEAIIHAFR